MPVARRENPAHASHSARNVVLEDILRDAACFARDEEVPTGLAHRALVHQIAAQDRNNRLPARVQNKGRSVALWLGGLSASTTAGALAAFLILVRFSAGVSTVSETPALKSLVPEQSVVRVAKNGVASPAFHAPVPYTRESSPTLASPPLPKRRTRIREISPRRIARSAPTVRNTAPAAEKSSASAVAPWQTEMVEETAYQLVTTAYVESPESHKSGSDHDTLTPVQMRIGLEPTETAMLPGSSELR